MADLKTRGGPCHSRWMATVVMLAAVIVSVEAIGASTLSIPEGILNGTLFVETVDWLSKEIILADSYYSNYIPDVPVSVVAWAGAMITFHTLAFALQLCDHFGLLQEYKAKSSGKISITYDIAMPTVLLNQICIWLPCMYLFECAGLGFQTAPTGMTVLHVITAALFMTLGHEFFFYIGHRWLLHSTWGYTGLGHNVHHSADATCGLTAMYMSPIDFMFEIIVPYLLPLAMVSPFVDGVVANTIFVAFGSLGGVYEHSGYNFFPYFKMLDTTAHLMHHRLYQVSYADGVGSPSILDALFETAYDSHKQKRN